VKSHHVRVPLCKLEREAVPYASVQTGIGGLEGSSSLHRQIMKDLRSKSGSHMKISQKISEWCR